MSKPFPRSYWVYEDKFLAGFYPGSLDSIKAEENIAALFRSGIRCFVNLMESDETDWSGNLFESYESTLNRVAKCMGIGVHYFNMPIVDVDISSVLFMKEILKIIDTSIFEMHEPVYVHCRGGIGRTGTVVGCWLIQHQFATPDNVIAYIKALRKDDPANYLQSPETEEQIEFVLNWERYV